MPGFVRGRRYIACEGGPRYLAVYEASSNAVLFSEPYLALKRNFDPNSLRFVPHFRNAQNNTLSAAVLHSFRARVAATMI